MTTSAAGALSIPSITADMSTLDAALQYAAAGWYVLPGKARDKSPRSVVGIGWPAKSSRDPQQIAAWFAGTDHALLIHLGRSDGIAFDTDNPEALPAVLVQAIAATQPPYQSTRDNHPGRGHYLFAVPPGRSLGNSTGKLGSSWGEIRGRNGVIVVAPTEHQKAADGGRYSWERTGLLPVLPDEVAAMLPDALDADDAATDAEVEAFLDEHVGRAQHRLLNAVMNRFAAKVAAGESRHVTAVGCAVWAMKEARAGCYPAREAVDRLREAFLEALKGERPGASEFAGIVAWSVAQAKAADLEKVRALTAKLDEASRLPVLAVAAQAQHPFTAPATVAAGRDALALFGRLLDTLRSYQDLPDPWHVCCVLATAATRDLDDEPVWLLLVAPPSGGKTEIIRMLDGTADARINEVTAAGLLSWRKQGKITVPAGVLTRIGDHGLLTFGDLSCLLATSDRGGRDQVFALLRRVYDGEASRDIANPGGTGDILMWKGRATVVAAVTSAIDHFSAHADALGPRWLFYRIEDRGTVGKRAAAGRARVPDLAGKRATASRLAAKTIRAAQERLPHVVLTDPLYEAVEDAALVTCWGRAAVPRHGYGRREIDGIPIIEEPPRLVRQLLGLARGLLALGLTADLAAHLARRVALDSMPSARYAVLSVLAASTKPMSTTKVASLAEVDRSVARRNLEELECVRVVAATRRGKEDEEYEVEVDRRPCMWSLDGGDGQIIADVFTTRKVVDEALKTVLRKVVFTPPHPPR